jgi:anion transporter
MLANKKWVFHILFYVVIGCFFYFGQETILTDFTTEQQLTVLLLFIAVYLWVMEPIPTGATSILLIVCMVLFRLVDSMEDAFSGFLSSALYFILVLSIISKSLVQVGADKVVAKLLIRISRGGPVVLMILLPLIILFLPIILPSTIARYKILLPLVEKVNVYYGFTRHSLFQKYCLYVIGMLNQNATIIIFTGGGFPILAYQLMKDFNVAEIGWLEWFLHIGPPLWGSTIVSVLFVWFFLSKKNKSTHEVSQKVIQTRLEKEERTAKLSFKFWIVMVTFLLMIIIWIITDQNKIPTLLPPMLLIVFYSLPKIGLVTNKVIRDFDWENFLLLGSSFSLGILIAGNGTASVLASQLIGIVNPESNIVIKVVIIAMLIFLLRFLFVVPSSAMIVIFPIIISYADILHVDALKLSFMIVMIVGGQALLPIHSPATYLAYETKILTKQEQYTIGAFSSFTMVAAAIIATLFYW